MAKRMTDKEMRFYLFECTQLFFNMGGQGLKNEPGFDLNRFKALHVTLRYVCYQYTVDSEMLDFLAEKVYEIYESNKK